MSRTVAVVRFCVGVVVTAGCLAGCTGRTASGNGSVARGVAAGVQDVRPQFPPLAHGASDGAAQAVLGLAESAGTVVAVGHDTSDGVSRPLLLWSGDDGRTWRRGTVESGGGATTSDTADVVVVRGGRFVALGNEGAGIASWTSDDGRTWQRRSLTGTAFGGATQVTGLTATAGGYVAVGHTQAAGARATPTAWTSPDARHWTPRGVSARLVGTAGSDVSLDGVATSDGALVVAVGSSESGRDDHERPRVWRSADGGVHWRAVALPDRFAGRGTRSFLHDVSWTGSRFVAVGSGGPGSPYAGVVATSADGSRWTAEVASGALARRTNVYLARAVGPGIVFGTTCGTGCSIYGAQRRAGRWVQVALPVAGEGDDLSLYTALRTAHGTTLLAGAADPHGDDDARIWRAGPGAGFVRIDPAPGARPAVRVADLASDGTTQLAVGSSGGLAVTWASTDGVHFTAPTVLARDPHAFVTGVDHDRAGWLVRGGERVGGQEQAVVWTSVDARHWRRSAAGTFGRAGPFAYSTVSAAVAFRGWTVVGERSDNGSPYASALSATSSHGGAWRGADAGSSHDQGVTPATTHIVYDLDGEVAGNRSMSAVAALGGGLLAVGSGQREQNAPGQTPAVWTTDDARTWRLDWLPMPPAAGSAQAQAVAVRGSTIAVLGTWTAGDSTGLAAWASPDAGLTWTVRTLPGRGGSRFAVDIAGLLVTTRGFVAVGTSGRRGSAVPFVATSVDGRTWPAAALTDRRLAGPGDWTVTGAVGTAAGVQAVAQRTSLAGVRTFTFVQRI